MTELTAWTQTARRVNFRFEVKDGRAQVQVTAAVDDDQIIYITSNVKASELLELSRLAAEAAAHTREI